MTAVVSPATGVSAYVIELVLERRQRCFVLKGEPL